MTSIRLAAHAALRPSSPFRYASMKRKDRVANLNRLNFQSSYTAGTGLLTVTENGWEIH